MLNRTHGQPVFVGSPRLDARTTVVRLAAIRNLVPPLIRKWRTIAISVMPQSEAKIGDDFFATLYADLPNVWPSSPVR
jgi:hypothetical protein